MNPALRKGLRVLTEIGVILLGLAVLGVIAKGLSPLSAGLSGLLRALLNPFVLAAVGLLIVLLRSARPRRSPGGASGRRSRGEAPRRDAPRHRSKS